MNTIRKHLPSPAMLVACVALTVALGGVSYAASVLPKNSVGRTQIKRSAVVSKKVKDHSLLVRDFKPGQLPAGPQGPKGDKGDSGKDGASATKLWAVVDAGGNIVASSGLATPGPVKAAAAGDYVVPFDRDISHCARVATIGGAYVLAGTQPAFITTFLASATAIEVSTDSQPGIGSNRPFSLAVFC